MRLVDWPGVGLVAVGAVAGALVRFAVSSAWPTRAFPWATLVVNLGGAFLIGLVMLPGPAPHVTRLWFVVGFLGALTTLSTYSFETVDLWRAGHVRLAVANVALNGIGGPVLAIVGWRVRVGLS